MQTAISYVRFSSKGQIGNSSIERQLNMAREYCATHNLTLDEQFCFSDLGVSARKGKNATEGGLGDFLEAAMQGLIPINSVLLIEEFSRMSRLPVNQAMNLLQQILDYVDVAILSTGERFSKATFDLVPMITALLKMDAVNAENELRRDRIIKARELKRKDIAKGSKRIVTKQCPFWMRLSEDRTKWVLIPEAVKVVKDVFQWSQDGMGTYVIVKKLNELDIAPPKVWITGKTHDKHGIKFKWGLSSVSFLIKSDAPLGTFNHKTEGVIVQTTKDYYPRVISDEQFNIVQVQRRARKGKSGGPTSTNLNNLFKGLLRCHCGSAMNYTGKGDGFSQLCCRERLRSVDCDQDHFNYKKLEEHLVKIFNCLDYSLLAGDKTTDIQAALAELELSKLPIEKKVSNLGKAIAMAEEEDIADLMALRKSFRGELNVIAGQCKTKQSELATAAGNHTDAYDSLKIKTFDDRTKYNNFLKRFVEQIIFNGLDIYITFKGKPFKFKTRSGDLIDEDTFAPCYREDREVTFSTYKDYEFIFEGDVE